MALRDAIGCGARLGLPLWKIINATAGGMRRAFGNSPAPSWKTENTTKCVFGTPP